MKSAVVRTEAKGTVTAKPGSPPKSLTSGNQLTIAKSATIFWVTLVLLLEPVDELSVLVVDDYVGAVMSDLSSRRGRVLGMESKGAGQVIKALVPMAEVLKYAPDLRSIT